MASRRPVLLLCLVLVLLAAGCVRTPGGHDDGEPLIAADAELLAFYDMIGTGREVRFETDHGPIRIVLYEGLMPRTTAHIAALIAAGFYDETLIHRVVDDFVIQGGDPSRTGQLGSGETVAFERHEDLRYGAGAMGLARDVDRDSGDSQWFITERPQPHLHDVNSSTAAAFGTYALFGQVIEGMDVVRTIASVPTLPGLDRPFPDVYLDEAVLAPPPMIDLLALPTTLHPGLTIAPHGLHLERPLHVFAGHAVPFTVYVRSPDDAAPLGPITLRLDGPDSPTEVAMTPLADDANVRTAWVNLTQAGPYAMSLHAGGTAAAGDLVVQPWHADYGRYDRRALGVDGSAS